MARLGVNIDHVATLRQARGGNEPDPVAAAVLVELGGADGIVVHLREDRRHIQDRDLTLLRQTIQTKLDLELAAEESMVKNALQLKPHLVTLVPERRWYFCQPVHRTGPQSGQSRAQDCDGLR
jgi:pyridoxine 5-phosphate synthase